MATDLSLSRAARRLTTPPLAAVLLLGPALGAGLAAAGDLPAAPRSAAAPVTRPAVAVAQAADTARVPAERAPGSNALTATGTRPGHRGSVGCLIGPERTADIGSPVTGVVAAIRVERGDSVRKGQVVALLEQEIERANWQAAQVRSALDAELRSAEASFALARERHERMASLSDSGAVAAISIEQARAEQDVAMQRVEQARGQQRVALQELGVAKAQLAQRTLKAPFDGVIVERLAHEGERVEDRPLLRLAQMDPLRVELVMPAARWGSVQRGEPLAIVPELPGATPLTATVTHIDRMLDAASNTFRVRLTLPNPEHRVPAGARCRLDTAGEAGAPASAPAASAPAPASVGQAAPLARVRPTAWSPAGLPTDRPPRAPGLRLRLSL